MFSGGKNFVFGAQRRSGSRSVMEFASSGKKKAKKAVQKPEQSKPKTSSSSVTIHHTQPIKRDEKGRPISVLFS